MCGVSVVFALWSTSCLCVEEGGGDERYIVIHVVLHAHVIPTHGLRATNVRRIFATVFEIELGGIGLDSYQAIALI